MHVHSFRCWMPCGALAAGLAWALLCGSSLAQQQPQQGNGQSGEGAQQQSGDESYTQYTGREHGSLGVTLSDNGRGDVWVSTVVPTSPADRAGLRPGDQIVGFDNQAIHSYRDAVSAMNRKGPQDRVAVHVLRNGQAGTLTANLVPHQMLGGPGNAVATQGNGPGYFRHPQGHTQTYVVPTPGYVAGSTNQPTFNTSQQTNYNGQQASYNGQQANNNGQQASHSNHGRQNGQNAQQSGGNNGQGFPPLIITRPPLLDDTGNNAGIQPTGPSF